MQCKQYPTLTWTLADSQLSLEKLNARLTVNLNNRMNMMDKREMMREGGEDAEMDEDPEMLDANM